MFKVTRCDCHGSAAGRGRHPLLWGSDRVLPSRDRDTPGDNGCRRDAETGTGDEVASRDDRLHLFVSWRAPCLSWLLAC